MTVGMRSDPLSQSVPQPYQSAGATALQGTVAVPGDKSISHRCLMLAALASGRSEFTGLLEGEDVLATAAALQACGVAIERLGEGHWRVDGMGEAGLQEPAKVLDLGNSGTAVRLLMGLLAAYPITVTFGGDESLSKRPMGRVLTPLKQMGIQFLGRSGDRLPLTMRSDGALQAIRYKLPVASAQVKSAILLAALGANGTTVVIEPEPTRDHTERMLHAMGVDLHQEHTHEGVSWSIQRPMGTLSPLNLAVPGDPSSAAFLLGAAAIVPGSALTLTGVSTNPLRIGFITMLQEMGADITLTNPRLQGGEPVADIVVRHAPLRAVDIPASRAPSMIDEYLIAAVVAAFATGTSVFRGLAELRVKESDRLAAAADGLSLCGVTTRIEGDDLHVVGCGAAGVPGGATILAQLDHRIAMSFLVMGMASQQPVQVDDVRPVLTSFPNFVPLFQQLGARLQLV